MKIELLNGIEWYGIIVYHSIGFHFHNVDILLNSLKPVYTVIIDVISLSLIPVSTLNLLLKPVRLAWPSIRAELTRWKLKGDIIAQLGELSETATFDVAVLQHVLCSVEDPHNLLLEARQLLKPGRAVDGKSDGRWK